MAEIALILVINYFKNIYLSDFKLRAAPNKAKIPAIERKIFSLFDDDGAAEYAVVAVLKFRREPNRYSALPPAICDGSRAEKRPPAKP